MSYQQKANSFVRLAAKGMDPMVTAPLAKEKRTLQIRNEFGLSKLNLVAFFVIFWGGAVLTFLALDSLLIF